jgi:hypothetical protein
MQTLFRDPPSAALKVLLLAALVSYGGVAATHVEGCFPHDGECLLLTPAVLVYWAQPAYLRLKAEGGFSVAIGGFVCIGLQAIVRAVMARTSGSAHHVAATLDHYLHTQLGAGLVLGAFGLAAYWALRRMQRPADNEPL